MRFPFVPLLLSCGPAVLSTLALLKTVKEYDYFGTDGLTPNASRSDPGLYKD
jgi:hypothetical protein